VYLSKVLTLMKLHYSIMQVPLAREGNTSSGFKDFCRKNGSSKGQNLASTGLFVPNMLSSCHSVLRFGNGTCLAK